MPKKKKEIPEDPNWPKGLPRSRFTHHIKFEMLLAAYRGMFVEDIPPSVALNLEVSPDRLLTVDFAGRLEGIISRKENLGQYVEALAPNGGEFAYPAVRDRRGEALLPEGWETEEWYEIPWEEI